MAQLLNTSVSGTLTVSSTVTSGALTVKGIADTGAYSQGGFNKAYANLILHGDSTYGVSGIVFKSIAGDTAINHPSDVAFIQYHPHGLTPAAYNSTPTETSSGEKGRLVMGVGNDTGSDYGEEIWIQTPGANDLKHYVVNTGYTILDSNNYSTWAQPKGSYLTSSNVSSSNNTASWGSAVTVGTVGGTDLKFTMPSNPNTDHYAWSDITGKPLSGNSGNNGPTWGNYVPVKSDGVIEIGKYIDFHNSSNDGVDYAVRLQCQGNNQVAISLPTSAGTLALVGDNNHTHSYLPLSGGTMTGSIEMSNGDITNVNQLTFNDPGANEGIIWNGGNGWKIYESSDSLDNTSGNLQFVVNSARAVTINTSKNLICQGTITGTSIYASSDRRLKENFIKPDINFTELLCNLKLTEFNFKDQINKDDKYLGLIAQNLKKALPEKYRGTFISKTTIGASNKEYLTINEGKFSYLLLGGWQDHEKIINKQQRQIDKLKEENKDLKKRLAKLEKLVDKLLDK